MKRIIILALVSLITLGVSAQKTASKNEQTVTIQTNGVCQKCADKFKENVPYFKGVKSYTYDMKTAKLIIKANGAWQEPIEGVRDGDWCFRFTLPSPVQPEAVKLLFNRGTVELYEFELFE